MVLAARRLTTNADGPYYVDDTCIDCAACRWIAPASFDDRGNARRDLSRVYRQPETDAEKLRADMALLACPVAAIGAEGKHDFTAAMAAFPDPLPGTGDDGVHHCGYLSEKTYGGASWLIVRPAGNVLIDSPRFTGSLVRRLEALGGIATMFLSHCDDVGDHARFAAHFGCERILHKADVRAGTRGVERIVSGEDPVALDADLTLIPVPGHTRGSMCLHYRDRYLFTGDHLSWDTDDRAIRGYRSVCWYDWDRLVASTERLLAYDFEWLLPGHGVPCNFPRAGMREELRKCVAWMRGG